MSWTADDLATGKRIDAGIAGNQWTTTMLAAHMSESIASSRLPVADSLACASPATRLEMAFERADGFLDGRHWVARTPERLPTTGCIGATGVEWARNDLQLRRGECGNGNSVYSDCSSAWGQALYLVGPRLPSQADEQARLMRRYRRVLPPMTPATVSAAAITSWAPSVRPRGAPPIASRPPQPGGKSRG